MRDRPRLVGINHVALEVGGVDEALEFYGRLFSFTLRGKSAGAAFVDMGNQSLALERSHAGSRDGGRHFGLVVADALGTVGYFRDPGGIASRSFSTTRSSSRRYPRPSTGRA